MNMWNSESHYDKLMDGWQRSESNRGVPYYLNHKSEKTQWDHPFLVKTMEELVDFDDVKYAAYRTALKLRFLQKRLQLDLVDLASISDIFNRHGYPSTKDTVLDCRQLANILLDIFSVTRKVGPAKKSKPEESAELLLNWILNLYDINRTGCIRVHAVKIGLAAMCTSRLSEKYRFFFRLMSDHTNHISRKRLHSFLHDMMQVPEMMNESIAFGGLNVGPAVDSCFQAAWNMNGISEDVLIEWLLKEPQTLIWLPTMHRLSAAETVKHESKCNICKTVPIIGFRYKCLKCFNFDMCQQCFFTGRTAKNHKLKHPIQEYCLATTKKEDTKAFMKTVRNNLSKKHKNKKKLRYLPVYGTDEPYMPEEDKDEVDKDADGASNIMFDSDVEEDPVYFEEPQVMEEMAMVPASPYSVPAPQYKMNSGAKRELESIINNLEGENRELMKVVEKMHGMSEQGSDSEDSEAEWLREEREMMEAKQEILESHNQQLEKQLQRLRHLIENNQGSPQRPVTPRHSHQISDLTPMAPPAYGQPHSFLQSPMLPLEIDTTYGSADPSLGRTHFSLPDQTQVFPDEEAELDGLIDRLDGVYPNDMSPRLDNAVNQSTLEEMYRAANKIGDAMTDLVGNVQPVDAAELLAEYDDEDAGIEGATGYSPPQRVPEFTPTHQNIYHLQQASLMGTSSA